MSEYRAQALVDAPVEEIWQLVGDPRHHPLWWPRVMEVQGTKFDAGDAYVQVTQGLLGREETQFVVEKLEDMTEIKMRCQASGTYSQWHLTPAQGGTFVDVRFGIDPKGFSDKVFALTAGRPFLRRWLHASVEALKEVAESRETAERRETAESRETAGSRAAGSS